VVKYQRPLGVNRHIGLVGDDDHGLRQVCDGTPQQAEQDLGGVGIQGGGWRLPAMRETRAVTVLRQYRPLREVVTW
jgi:hypothetical protein